MCYTYGKVGGDESFEKNHSNLKEAFHYLHHWCFGIIAMAIAFGFSFTNFNVICVPLGGFGLGLYIDDALFHSFECYFQRKVCE